MVMNEERYTFSSLLSKLIEIQDRLAVFYGSMEEESSLAAGGALSSFAKDCEGIKRELEKIKRESIIEFALEPISGLRLNDLSNRIEEATSNKNHDVYEKVKMIEEEKQRLFSEVSKKLAPMSAEVSQLLLNANKKSNRRLELLRAQVKNT